MEGSKKTIGRSDVITAQWVWLLSVLICSSQQYFHFIEDLLKQHWGVWSGRKSNIFEAILFEVTLEFHFDLYSQTLVISYTFYPFSQWIKRVVHLQFLIWLRRSFSLSWYTLFCRARSIRLEEHWEPVWLATLTFGKGALRWMLSFLEQSNQVHIYNQDDAFPENRRGDASILGVKP